MATETKAKKKTMRHASALKAHRKSLARRIDNYHVRNRVRTLTKSALKEIQTKNAEAAKTAFKNAQSAWQKAAQRGIFSRNAAARQISRMASQLATLVKR